MKAGFFSSPKTQPTAQQREEQLREVERVRRANSIEGELAFTRIPLLRLC
jgi:hypothetical protein